MLRIIGGEPLMHQLLTKQSLTPKNNPAIGTVNFTPFLNQLNPQAPAAETVNYTPAPAPTPYPTTIPAPTPTPYATTYATPRPAVTLGPIATPTPTSTPTPTPKVMPGSPLSMGGESFAEALSQFDITQIVSLVLTALGIMWAIVILAYVGRHFGTKKKPKNERSNQILI
jgi:hypothetical protein